MRVLLVGPDNEKFFSKRTTWEFDTALEAADPGDTIEFMKDFSPYYEGHSKQIIIDKDLTLLGNLDKSNGHKQQTNVLSNILVINGATVTLKNIQIRNESDKSNSLMIKDNSSVSVETVFFENLATSTKVSPIVFLSENSSADFKDVFIQENPEPNTTGRVFVNNSTLTVSDSIINVSVHGNNSKLIFNDTFIQNKNRLALFADNQSVVQLTATRLIGGKIIEDSHFASVRLVNSEGIFKDVLIETEADSSQSAKAKNYSILSIVENSAINFDQLTVQPSADLNLNTRVFVEDSILTGSNANFNVQVYGNHAELTFNEGLIQNRNSNAVFAHNQSIVQLTATNLIGGKITDDMTFPSLKLIHSDGTFKDVFIETEAYVTEQSNWVHYNIVSIEDQANVDFDQLTINPNVNLNLNTRVFVKDSSLTGSNTNFNVGVSGDNAELTFNEVLIQNKNSNALFASNQSVVQLTATDLIGGKITEDSHYPAMKLLHSEGVFENILIEQPNFYGAMDFTHSQAVIKDSQVDSLLSLHSNLTIDNIVIVESFFAKDHSTIKAKVIEILGRVNGKFNLYANSNTSIQADILYLGNAGFPEIKLEYNVHLAIEKIQLLTYDADNNDFQKDTNGDVIPLEKEPDIIYFGEKRPSQRLDELIGIHHLKEEIKELVDVAYLNQLRDEKGLKNSSFFLHSLFLGNPGSGKTTVARIIAELLYEKNLISKNIFIEVSYSDLVGNDVGQTAPKTHTVLESALGGVLFIDEAYTLSSGGSNDFGGEAINEILTFMENHRKDIVIIFAGYTDEMNAFLETNKALRSRIPNVFDFPEYSPDELVEIGLMKLYEQEYQINEETYRQLVYNNYDHSYDYTNGRWVRNLNERIFKKVASRIVTTDSSNLTKIIDEDLYSLMR